jgi:hypothetical protein
MRNALKIAQERDGGARRKLVRMVHARPDSYDWRAVSTTTRCPHTSVPAMT